MFRLVLLFNLLLVNLLSCSFDCSSCQKKLLDSKSIFKNYISIPIEMNRRLIYSTTKPKGTILKYDPFLSLYLIKDKQKFKYPFKINSNLSLSTSMIDAIKNIPIKIIKNQVGLNSLAEINRTLIYPSIITNSCCNLIALVTPRGVIQREYIERFMSSKNVSYSDIGIRVKQSKKRVVITRVNPFVKSKFRVGDVLISLNSKKISRASSFMRTILFSKIEKKFIVKVKRGKKIVTIKTTSQKRYGNIYDGDTFLESRGLYLSENLRVTKLSRFYENSGLKIGDKILKVANTNMKTRADLLLHVEKFTKDIRLLISRDGFEFFISLRSPI